MSRLPELVSVARVSGDYDPVIAAIPYLRFIGAQAQVHDGKVRVYLPYQPMLVGNVRLPSLHGGVAGACLETAALLQLIHEKGSLPMPKTIDFTIDYLRAAGAAGIYADADVQRAGRRVANVRMRAWQADPEQPVVLGRGNFLLLD
jgi:uncharacterized protein (TIGR00369 family)